MDKKLENYLKKHGIRFKEYEHSAVSTVEESRKLKNDIPGLHCKTLFLKDDSGKFYLVGLPAEKRLDSKIFRKLLGIKKVRFGSPEELKNITELVPGSVSIFGMVNAKKRSVLVLDGEVFSAKSVGFHPNINTSTIVLKHKDLKKFYDSLNCKKDVLEL